MRYIGIDTPESVKPARPCSASPSAPPPPTRRSWPGRSVRLVGDVERRDRYGRLLAYVYREPDGAFATPAGPRRLRAHPDDPPNVRTPPVRRAGRAPRARPAEGCGRLRYREITCSCRHGLDQVATELAASRSIRGGGRGDRLRRERIYREAEQRLDTRRRDRVHKRGSMRFALLVLVLLATAALFTVAMFKDALRGDGVAPTCATMLVEELAARAWPAAETHRADAGCCATRRRDAPAIEPALPVGDAHGDPALVEEFYAATAAARSSRSPPPRRATARPVLARPGLVERGPTDVLVADGRPRCPRGGRARSRSRRGPTRAGSPRGRRGGAPRRRRARERRVLARASSRPAAYAGLASEGAGVGLAVCERGWAGLFGVRHGARCPPPGRGASASCTR